jgi:hypothetical protein
MSEREMYEQGMQPVPDRRIAVGSPPVDRQLAFARVATALAVTSMGALAVGALAIGRLAIKGLRVQDGRIERLVIEELEVSSLRVRELITEQKPGRFRRRSGRSRRR